MLRSIRSKGGKIAAGRATGMATGAVAGKAKLGLALAGMIFAVISLILSFLCLFAGHTPGFLENYALVTVDTSQIGENIIHKLDEDILALTSLNLKRDLETTSTVALRVETLSSTPSVTSFSTATITSISRPVKRGIISDIKSGISSVTSEGGSAVSQVESEAASVTSAVASKITSATGAVGSAAASEVAKIANEVVAEIDKDYKKLISAANLSDFTSFHLLAACHGTYEYSNGTNITVGGVAQYNATGLHKHVDYCKKESDLHLVLQAIAILYSIGIILISASFVLGILGAVKFDFCRWAFCSAVGAFAFVFLATLAAHGISHGAAKVIDFIGGPINVKSQVGEKFLAMSWANTVLLAVAAAIWGTMFFAGEGISRLGNKVKRPVIRKIDNIEIS